MFHTSRQNLPQVHTGRWNKNTPHCGRDKTIRALYGNAPELSDEDLQKASGGYLFSPEGTCQTQVINDQNGEVMASFFTRGEAIEYAYAHGQRAQYIGDAQPEALRKRAKGEN